MKAIDKNTPVTLGLVFIIIGGVVWLSSMAYGQRENKEKIKKIQTDQDKIMNLIQQQQVIMVKQSEQVKYIKETVREIKLKVTR